MKQRMVGKSTSARKGGGPTTPRNAEKTRKAKSPGFSLEEVNRIKEEREARRNAMKAAKEASAQKAKAYKDAGIVGDVDFLEMIDEWHATHPLIATPYLADPTMKLVVCVRKRPLNSKELSRQVHDCLTVANPYAVVHESQLSVDGYKYLKHLPLQFDYVFDENSETEDLYTAAVKPLVDFMVQGGHSTVFAYGQTGSGKTHTSKCKQCSSLSISLIVLTSILQCSGTNAGIGHSRLVQSSLVDEEQKSPGYLCCVFCKR